MTDRLHESVDSVQEPRDWTVDPETGVSNSSPEFLELAVFVGELVREQAHSLLNGGHSTNAGRFIMAQLAHIKNVGPLPIKE